MAQLQAKHEDKLCLLPALRNVVILRPWGDRHKIIGYSYIDGMLTGEMDHLFKGDNLQCFRIH
jgi:hypothetical protein